MPEFGYTGRARVAEKSEKWIRWILRPALAAIFATVVVSLAQAAPATPGPLVSIARSAIDDVPVPCTSATVPGFAGDASASSLPAEDEAAVESDRGLDVWDGRGPWGGNLKTIIADPADGNRMIVAAGLSMAREAGGVWVSTDGGVNWSDTSLRGIVVYAAVASPSEPGVFYAGVYDGFYRSTDSGATWTRISLAASLVIGCGVKVDDGNIVIAGLSSGAGIRRSVDRGVTWNTCGINSYFMKGLGTSPTAPDRMYLAMSGAPTFCYRSDDAGLTWTASAPAGDGWGLWVDPLNVDHVFASTGGGVYRTLDGGANWTLVLPGTCFANCSVKDGVVYAPITGSGPSGPGVYESNDDGATWTFCSTGIVANYFQCSGASATGVLAGHYGGVYRSTAPFGAWSVSQTGINNAYVRTVAYYADRHELWAATDQSGLWRSMDGGATWELKSTGLTNWSTHRLAPKDHAHDQGDRMYITTTTGIYRSTDHGETWQASGLSGELLRGVLVDRGTPDRVWTGSQTTQKVWRSEDAGANWQLVGTGIGAGFYPDFQVGKNPANGTRLFLNYEQQTNSLYYSDDLGTTFNAATGLGSSNYLPGVTVRDDNPALVFCGTGAGVYKSANYGASFTSSGLTSVIWSILGLTSDGVYAGRNVQGCQASHDDGLTWAPYNTGIETLVSWDFCYGDHPTDLFVGLRGHGVKQISAPVIDAVDGEQGGVPAGLAVAPNPFRTASTLRLLAPVRTDLDVRVFDATGRVVITNRLTSSGGAASWTWDGRDSAGRLLPSGTYFYEVRGGADRYRGEWMIVR